MSMKKEWKKTFIESLKFNRGAISPTAAIGTQMTAEQAEQMYGYVRMDDDLIADLDALLKKDLSNTQFIAQVLTTLEVYDAKVGNDSNSFGGFYASNVSVVENSLNNVEQLVDGEPEYANSWSSYSYSGPRYVYNLPVDFVNEVRNGIDLATGVDTINQEESVQYRDFLKEKVNEFVEDTGKAAVIAKPKGGSGYLFYTSDAIDERLKRDGSAPLSWEYLLPSMSRFGANDSAIIYFPNFELEGDANNYVPSGTYTEMKPNTDEDGRPTDADDALGEYAVLVLNPITGRYDSISKKTFDSVEEKTKLEQDPYTQVIQITEQNTYEDLQTIFSSQTQDAFEVFGQIPSDYFIYENVEAEYQEPTVEGFVQDTQEQVTVSDYGVDNLYGGMDHIAGDPAKNGALNWISLKPDEQEAFQLQLMQSGFLSPDHFYAEAGDWGTYTQAAMRTAMTEANYKFKKIGPYLQEVMKDYKNRPTIYPIVFPEPGPLATKNAVQSAVTSAGARTNLTPGEMQALATYFKDENVDYQKAVVDYERNLDLARRGIIPENKLVVPDTPSERTQARAEEVFAPEIESQARAQEQRRNVQYLTYSVDRMSDIIG